MTTKKTRFIQLGLLTGIVAFLLSGSYFIIKIKNRPAFDYFNFSCSIFSRNGELMWRNRFGYLACAYKRDGGYFAAKAPDDKFTLFDEQNRVIWSANDHIHHQMRFSLDGSKLLVIASELFDYENQKVRSDCFSVRNFQNEKEHEWCVKDHLAELKQLGYKFRLDPSDPATNSRLINAKNEIVHANSIYQIDQNDLSDRHPAFKKGNFIVNFWDFSGMVLILDRNMEKILWHVNSREVFKAALHDVQVTPEGNLLFYRNRNDSAGGKDFYSSLVEADPLTFKEVWSYEKTPREKFASEFMGSVQKLKNGNYLYSDTTNGGRVFEVTRDGQEVWSFTNPQKDAAHIPIELPQVRAFYFLSFFRARGIEFE